MTALNQDPKLSKIVDSQIEIFQERTNERAQELQETLANRLGEN